MTLLIEEQMRLNSVHPAVIRVLELLLKQVNAIEISIDRIFEESLPPGRAKDLITAAADLSAKRG